jgi:hypothetical protein
MRRYRWLRFVLLPLLVGNLVSVAVNLLLPAIFNSRLLFGGLVVLLLTCGPATIIIAVREMPRR